VREVGNGLSKHASAKFRQLSAKHLLRQRYALWSEDSWLKSIGRTELLALIRHAALLAGSDHACNKWFILVSSPGQTIICNHAFLKVYNKEVGKNTKFI